MRQAGLILAVGRVRSKKENRRKRKQYKIHPAPNTPRYPQQPGDRDHLETAGDETHPTRQPIHARFHRSRVCGNRPRTTLAIAYGKNGLGCFVPSACFFTGNNVLDLKKMRMVSTNHPPRTSPRRQSVWASHPDDARGHTSCLLYTSPSPRD